MMFSFLDRLCLKWLLARKLFIRVKQGQGVSFLDGVEFKNDSDTVQRILVLEEEK